MINTLIKKTNITNKAIWDIAYSIMLGNLAQTIIAMTDTAFLGRLGEVELGAASMSGIYYMVFTTLLWGFSIGVQVIVARRLGEGNLSKIGEILSQGLVFILGLACVLFSILNFVSPMFMHLVLTSERVYEVSNEYLHYRSFGIFFSALNFMFRSFYIGLSRTRCISYSTLSMALVNVTLDWVLVFGTPYTPALGVKGAAIASVTAEFSATVLFILYTLRTHPLGQYKTFVFKKLQPEIIRNILRLSLPTMLQKLASFGIWIAFFFMIESMGERPLAITMVVRNIAMMMQIPAFAFGAAASTLTSRLIGEGRAGEVVPTLWKVIRMSVLITLPINLFVLFFPAVGLGIYTDNHQLIEAAIPIAYMACVFSLCYCVAMPFFEAVSGTGYTKSAFYLELISLVLYISFIYVSVKVVYASLFTVWLSEILYSSTLIASSVLFMYLFNWRGRKV